MSEFTHVVSRSDASPTTVLTCPREMLGLSCLAGIYPCLCEVVSAVVMATQANDIGQPVGVSLNLDLAPGANPANVMADIERTGFLASFTASHQAVAAVFDLRKAQNADLRLAIGQTDR